MVVTHTARSVTDDAKLVYNNLDENLVDSIQAGYRYNFLFHDARNVCTSHIHLQFKKNYLRHNYAKK